MKKALWILLALSIPACGDDSDQKSITSNTTITALRKEDCKDSAITGQWVVNDLYGNHIDQLTVQTDCSFNSFKCGTGYLISGGDDEIGTLTMSSANNCAATCAYDARQKGYHELIVSCK